MPDPNRQYWNQQFKILQDTWPKPVEFEECIEICLNLHGMVHSRKVMQTCPWSFEDELWEGMTEEAFRKVHPGDQFIAWKLWHSSRIEDITMNVLIDDKQQIFSTDDWYAKLQVKAKDTGNAMDEEEIRLLSNCIDISALRDYRNEVGIETRSVIKSLSPLDLKHKIEPSRINRLLEEGAVVQEAAGLLEYWGKKTYSGLLLMPATRHNLVHLNESNRLLEKTK